MEGTGCKMQLRGTPRRTNDGTLTSIMGLRSQSRSWNSAFQSQKKLPARAILRQLFPSAKEDKRRGVLKAREELWEALKKGGVPRQKVDDLVDVLISNPVAFDAKMLGGGPWEVCYTRGALLWQQLTQAGQTARGRPKQLAYQDFDPSEGTVLNFGQLLGPQLYVTAEGTFVLLLDNNPGRRRRILRHPSVSGPCTSLGEKFPCQSGDRAEQLWRTSMTNSGFLRPLSVSRFK
eukprot:jgi/Botrbrau1/810/Bobra.0352s0007.1